MPLLGIAPLPYIAAFETKAVRSGLRKRRHSLVTECAEGSLKGDSTVC